MSKWTRVRGSLGRAHDDLGFPTATFHDFSESYDNVTDTWSDTKSQIGTEEVEFVPPEMDSTVSGNGTDVDFSTSIRVPESSSILSSLTVYGAEGERASEVEVEGATYVIEARRPESGSGFVLLRLSEV